MTLEIEKNKDGLSEREQLFLETLFTEANGNVRKAMTIAGYPNKEPESSVIRKLKNEIIERSKEYLGAHSAQAVLSLISVLSDPSAPGTDRVIKAVKEVLDRTRIGVDVQESREEKNIFILPQKSKIIIDSEDISTE